jgi:hypothetical protein
MRMRVVVVLEVVALAALLMPFIPRSHRTITDMAVLLLLLHDEVLSFQLCMLSCQERRHGFLPPSSSLLLLLMLMQRSNACLLQGHHNRLQVCHHALAGRRGHAQC